MINSLHQYVKTGLLCLFLFSMPFIQKVEAQYPTITCKYDTIHICPGTVIMPFTVKNADSVSAISILSNYNDAVLDYVGVVYTHPKLAASVSFIVNGSFGQLNIAWFGLQPTNFGTDTLFKFKFNYIGGVSPFIFDTTQVGNCEWGGPPQSDGTVPVIPSVYKNGRVDNLGYEALITQQPPDVILCENSNAFFYLIASYAQNYHWQVSTDGGTNFTYLTNDALYSGVNTSWLTITSPPLSYSGYKYRCLVDGICINNYSSIKTLTITPHNTPNAGPDDTICAGDFFLLTATAANATSHIWSHTGTGQLEIVAPMDSLHIKYTPSAADIVAGQVELTLTIGGSFPCTPTHSHMTLHILPLPLASAGPPVGGCQGDSIRLIASGGMTYNWSNGTSNDTIYVIPAATATYTVTVSNYGCSSTASVLVTVVPEPVVTASADATICAGSTFQPSVVTANVASVLWSTAGNGGFNSVIVPSPVYTASQEDIDAGFVWLYVRGLPNAPCAFPGIDSVLLTIKPYPNASAGADVSVCLGDPATLQASGGGTYVWSNGLTTSSITVSPTVTTNYYVTVTDQGCSKTDTAKVIIKALPPASAGNDTTICHASQATLIASGGVGYEWNTGVFAPIIVVSPIVTTTYVVTVTGTNGCKASADVTVLINSDLQVTVNPSNPFICQGESVNLHATSTHSCTFTWTPASFLNTTTGPDVTATSLYTITYTLEGKDALGCTATTQAVVTVFELPLVRVLPWSVKLCKGESVNLNVTGALTYYWEPPTGLSSNSNPNVIANPKESTTYVVTGTDANGCQASDSTVIEVNPVPFVNLPSEIVSCAGTNLLLDAGTAMDGCTFLWQNGTSASWQYATTPGTYWVQVERNGCMVWDSTEVLPCSELFIPNAFTPDGDLLNDEFKVISSGYVQEFHMNIYNRWGESIFETKNIDQGWDGRKDGELCPVGVYHYVIEYLGQGNVLLEKEGKRYGSVMLLR